MPYYSYVQSVQNIALSELLGYPERMRLIEDNEAMSGKDDKPLRVGEVFRTLTDAVWSDVADARKAAAKQTEDDDEAVQVELSKVRRNLQRLHLRRLLSIMMGPRSLSGSASYAVFAVSSPYPSEARSLARLHVKEIQGLIAD
ncbi:MAG TPA: hypothetical protein PKC18_19895, partial [Lacipirellulaceae bacterium]|nr:hypothetical protein [Lacipirellulaceae bacterium]